MRGTRGSGEIIRLRVPAGRELWGRIAVPGRKFRRIPLRFSARAVPKGRLLTRQAGTVPNSARLRGGGRRGRRQVAERGPSSCHQRWTRLKHHQNIESAMTFMNVVFVFYLIFWLGACTRCAPRGHHERLLRERRRSRRRALATRGFAGTEQHTVTAFLRTSSTD